MSYTEDAQSDARDMVDNFRDEIIQQLVDNGEASDDLLNDYPEGDSYHHETHVDRFYDLTDAADLLDELSDHEETDSGLWYGQGPRRAIGTQAAYTYGNAVMSEWRDLIREINEEFAERAESEVDDLSDLSSHHFWLIAGSYGFNIADSDRDKVMEEIDEKTKRRIAEEVVQQITTTENHS